jgi:hypothetical protein
MNKKQFIERMVKHTDSPQGRSQKTPGSFHDHHNRGTQGGRGGPAAWLREVLRQGAEGEGRQKPSDWREDADRGSEGSVIQGGQGSQGVCLVSAKASRWHRPACVQLSYALI